jgi:hemoglobin
LRVTRRCRRLDVSDGISALNRKAAPAESGPDPFPYVKALSGMATFTSRDDGRTRGTTQAEYKMTLFERIGGHAAVDAAVERFYEIVLGDDRIRHFFVGADMQRQATHQRAFLTYAFGGSPGYAGRSMQQAHGRLVRDMGLSDAHFDAVLDNLGAALRDLGVAPDLVAEVLATAETTRAAVLGRAV